MSVPGCFPFFFLLLLYFFRKISPSLGDMEKAGSVLRRPFLRYSFTLLRILSILSRALHVTSPMIIHLQLGPLTLPAVPKFPVHGFAIERQSGSTADIIWPEPTISPVRRP
jgi:hypothetical protein